MNTSQMQQVEAIFVTPVMKPLLHTLIENLKLEFKNQTPLAKSFVALVDELASPQSKAFPETMNIGEKMMVAGIANTILQNAIVKGK